MQDAQQRFVTDTVIQSIQEADDQGVNCADVNIEQFGEVGESISSYLVNVDLSSSQFSVDTLVEQAAKLGMDFGDLQEYGLDLKSGSCGGKTCFRKEDFKNFD